MFIRRILSGVAAAATVIAVTAACGSGHHSNGRPLTITSYRGADWITDSAVTPPKTLARADRVRYPHSMDGTVMAAVDSQTLLDIADDEHYGDVARDYFAIGDGLTAYLAARAQVHVTGDPDKAKVPRVKGFRFLSYTDNTAEVEVFFAQPDQSITGLTRHLVWLSDTWLIQLPAPGAPDKPMKAYDTLPDNTNTLPQT